MPAITRPGARWCERRRTQRSASRRGPPRPGPPACPSHTVAVGRRPPRAPGTARAPDDPAGPSATGGRRRTRRRCRAPRPRRGDPERAVGVVPERRQHHPDPGARLTHRRRSAAASAAPTAPARSPSAAAHDLDRRAGPRPLRPASRTPRGSAPSRSSPPRPARRRARSAPGRPRRRGWRARAPPTTRAPSSTPSAPGSPAEGGQGDVLAVHVLGVARRPAHDVRRAGRRRRPLGPAGRARHPRRTAPSSPGGRTGTPARPGRRSCGRPRRRTRAHRARTPPSTTRPPPMPVPSVTITPSRTPGARRSAARPVRRSWRRSRRPPGASGSQPGAASPPGRRRPAAGRFGAKPQDPVPVDHARAPRPHGDRGPSRRPVAGPAGSRPARRRRRRPRRRGRSPVRRSGSSTWGVDTPASATTAPSPSSATPKTLVPPMSTPMVTRRPAGRVGHAEDSTRAFNSRSAVDMIRLCARILMKPGIGTRNSTSRWYVTSVPPSPVGTNS